MHCCVRALYMAPLMLSVSIADADAKEAKSPNEQLRAVESELVSAARARDVTRLAAYYATDAEIISPGEVIRGRAAFLSHIRPLTDASILEIERTPERITTSAAGDFGYVTGRYTNRYRGKEGGATAVVQGAYVAVYRRAAGQSWQIVLDMTAPEPK